MQDTSDTKESKSSVTIEAEGNMSIHYNSSSTKFSYMATHLHAVGEMEVEKTEDGTVQAKGAICTSAIEIRMSCAQLARLVSYDLRRRYENRIKEYLASTDQDCSANGFVQAITEAELLVEKLHFDSCYDHDSRIRVCYYSPYNLTDPIVIPFKGTISQMQDKNDQPRCYVDIETADGKGHIKFGDLSVCSGGTWDCIADLIDGKKTQNLRLPAELIQEARTSAEENGQSLDVWIEKMIRRDLRT